MGHDHLEHYILYLISTAVFEKMTWKHVEKSLELEKLTKNLARESSATTVFLHL